MVGGIYCWDEDAIRGSGGQSCCDGWCKGMDYVDWAKRCIRKRAQSVLLVLHVCIWMAPMLLRDILSAYMATLM